MRIDTFEILRCPFCGGRLELEQALARLAGRGELVFRERAKTAA